MPEASSRPSARARPRLTWAAALLAVAAAAAAGEAAAQDARYFSPTYAASDGSPYSSVYARTFGAGGPPPAQAPAAAPLVTGAGPAVPATPAAPVNSRPDVSPDSSVVYVIQNGRLLTYRAEDYARGRGAVAGAAVPPAATGSAAATPPAELSSITGRFYGAPTLSAPPLPTAAGPIQLVPPASAPQN